MDAFDDHLVCDVTTVGRSTGRPHTIEIWFAAEADTIYLLSGGGDRSDWVRNLLADPRVTVAFDGDRYQGRASVLERGPDASHARRLVFAKYQPRYAGDLTSWRDTALPVRIDLDRNRGDGSGVEY